MFTELHRLQILNEAKKIKNTWAHISTAETSTELTIISYRQPLIAHDLTL